MHRKSGLKSIKGGVLINEHQWPRQNSGALDQGKMEKVYKNIKKDNIVWKQIGRKNSLLLLAQCRCKKQTEKL